MRRVVRLALTVAVLGAAFLYYMVRARDGTLVLTGLVTTDEVIVSAQIAGRIETLAVEPGKTVGRGEVIAVLAPGELQADRAYYAHVADSALAGIEQNLAALRAEALQTAASVRQADAEAAAAEATLTSTSADLAQARVTLARMEQLQQRGLAAADALDQARATVQSLDGRVQSLARQVEAAQAAAALARANAEQAAVRRSQVASSRAESAAAVAQRDKAAVRLGYAEVRAPIAGIVDVRAARQGEVVTVGQPIVTLINPDDLWVRVDIEETYIDRVRIGDAFPVVLPSGDERVGTVFYRAADGGFATQRDVSRSKRDIRTFEVRLRVPDPDHRLAVGMTASVRFTVPR